MLFLVSVLDRTIISVALRCTNCMNYHIVNWQSLVSKNQLFCQYMGAIISTQFSYAVLDLFIFLRFPLVSSPIFTAYPFYLSRTNTCYRSHLLVLVVVDNGDILNIGFWPQCILNIKYDFHMSEHKTGCTRIRPAHYHYSIMLWVTSIARFYLNIY